MSTNKSIGIVSVGHYLPDQSISNHHFVDRGLDTTPEWIESRSGIKTRHIAANTESTSDLATQAAKSALTNGPISVEDLDFIIVATATPDHHGFPSTACLVQKNLCPDHPIESFDITAACSGFAYGLSLAYAKISAGIGTHGLVIGAETLSRLVDWSDRRTAILFGDGAGAAIVGPVQAGGFLGFDQGADGQAAGILCCTPQANTQGFNGTPQPDALPMIHMDGQAVFKQGVQVVVESLKLLFKQHSMPADQVDYVICHQANIRILESVAKKMGIPFEKFLTNIDRVGNTSAASIPLVLAEYDAKHQFSKGDIICLVGFGAGFTWSSILLEWS